MLYPFSRLCRPARRKGGFNLIESAIVLGVVGLVIGGIWVAAAGVVQKNRINHTVTGFLQIINTSRHLFTESDYPPIAPPSTLTVTSVISAAGGLPGDFIYTSGEYAKTPVGAYFKVFLTTFTSPPAISISLNGPGHSTLSGAITTSDCVEIIRRIGGMNKEITGLRSVQLYNGAYIYFYPPFDPASVNCPANTSFIAMYFTTKP